MPETHCGTARGKLYHNVKKRSIMKSKNRKNHMTWKQKQKADTVKRKLISSSFFMVMVLLLLGSDSLAQDELNVIQGESSNNNWIYYRDAPNALYHHISSEAFQLLDERAEAVSKLHTRSDWEQRRHDVRQTIAATIGPFPEKTPLNPRVMRTIEKEHYTVEHIIYESQPGFNVTSSLFLPHEIQQPAPAILYVSGHTVDGYRSPTYQHKILNLVKKGFIVFAFDPVGQGERLEYYDPQTGQSVVGRATLEHSYSSVQAYITGSSLAMHMTWDGIRAIDYLVTREEVDPERIGVTGRSGGGTQTAYIAAIDDRVLAAAPESWITNYTRVLQTIGPQDAEQNLYQGILRGIDKADYLIARAPKPTLIITTTEDFFSIQGAREAFKEVSEIYRVMGHSDQIDMVEDGGPHASTKKNREAMYAFFQKHLSLPGNPLDEEVAILSEDDMKVTPTGQLATSLGGETIFSLSRKQTQKQFEELQTSRARPDRHLPAAVQAAKEVSGYREPAEIGDPVFTGRIQRDGYVIEKYFIAGEGDYVIPYLLMIPDQPNNKALLYFHPSGKAAEAGEDGEISWFVKNGFTVLAPDLIGTGEMGPGELRNYVTNVKDFDTTTFDVWVASVMTGRSITGIRAGDAVRLTRLLLQNEQTETVYAAARGDMAPVVLHAAAFEPAIERVALLNPYISFRSIVRNRYYDPGYHLSSVAGSLEKYDLPDLAASLAPRELLIAGPTDASGTCNDSEGIRGDIAIITDAYEYKNATHQVNITSCGTTITGQRDTLFPNWIGQSTRAD